MPAPFRFLTALLAALWGGALPGRAGTEAGHGPVAPVGEWRRTDGRSRLVIRPGLQPDTLRFVLLTTAASRHGMRYGAAAYEATAQSWQFQAEDSGPDLHFRLHAGHLIVETSPPISSDDFFCGHYLPVLKGVELPARLAPSPSHRRP